MHKRFIMQTGKNILIYQHRGFHIYLNWTLLVLLVFILIAGAWSGGWERMMWSMLVIVVILSSILLHECAHAFAAALAGISTREVILLPTGGVSGIQKFPDQPVKEFFMSVAGPLFSLALAFLAYRILALHTVLPETLLRQGDSSGYYVLFIFYIVNLSLGIFNLVPAFPMDGGRIIRSLLAIRFNYVRATNMVYHSGRVVAIVLLLLSVFTENILPALTGLYIILTFPEEHTHALINSLVKGMTAGKIAVVRFYLVPADMSVEEACELLRDNDNRYFVLQRDGASAGSVSRFTILEAFAAGKGNSPLWVLPHKTLRFVEATEPVETLLETLARHPDDLFTVLENNSHIKGVISYRILMEHLLLHNRHRKNYRLAKSLALAAR